MTKRFQLVIQFPEDFFPTFDAMTAFEDRLIASMPRTCEADGHDIGSGTINFFVYTDAPDAAHRAFRKYLGTRAVEKRLRIAYRAVDGDAHDPQAPNASVRDRGAVHVLRGDRNVTRLARVSPPMPKPGPGRYASARMRSTSTPLNTRQPS